MTAKEDLRRVAKDRKVAKEGSTTGRQGREGFNNKNKYKVAKTAPRVASG